MLEINDVVLYCIVLYCIVLYCIAYTFGNLVKRMCAELQPSRHIARNYNQAGKSRNISLTTVPVVNGNVTFDIGVFAAAVVAKIIQWGFDKGLWGPVTFNAPDGAGTQLRYSPRTAACLRLRCHCHFINRST